MEKNAALKNLIYQQKNLMMKNFKIVQNRILVHQKKRKNSFLVEKLATDEVRPFGNHHNQQEDVDMKNLDSNEIIDNNSPIYLFDNYLDNQFYNFIIEESKKYVDYKRSSNSKENSEMIDSSSIKDKFTKENLKKFIALHLFIGVITLP